ncbi:MAG: MAPEG family protein [Alphaproteobacteria bacterium]
MQDHYLVALVTVGALILFTAAGIGVGRARYKYGVQAPAVTGHEIFERHIRAQMNTLEQLVVFLPSLWLFALYWGDLVATILGVLWLIARTVYIIAYVREPSKRGPAFGIGWLIGLILLIGAAAGAIRGLIA